MSDHLTYEFFPPEGQPRSFMWVRGSAMEYIDLQPGQTVSGVTGKALAERWPECFRVVAPGEPHRLTREGSAGITK